jgi:hypothetical protein
MQIDPDYFIVAINDPSPQALEKTRQELLSLLSQGWIGRLVSPSDSAYFICSGGSCLRRFSRNR